MFNHENTIIKVVIHKGEFLKVSFNQNIPGGKDKNNRECGARIHPDLVNAFGALDIHLANLTFQRNSEGYIDSAAVHCSGYEMDLKDENGIKVKLLGARHLESNKTLDLVSPKQNILETGIEIYEYAGREDLDKALRVCDEEVRAYLFEGKHAEDVQMQMDLDSEEVPKKAKGRRKKDALAELTEMVQDGTLTISTNKSATDVSADKEEF